MNYNNKENANSQIINNNIDLKLLYVLKNLDLEYLINSFNYHHIKFIDLFHLKKQDYLEMNIPIGPRNRIINFINDYKIFAKKYDLNELKIFFKNNNIKNGIINEYSVKNINKKRISHSDKDLILRNKNNIENIKTYYKYHSYYSNDLIFQNNKNEEFKNSSNLLNKYNSLSDILNKNIPNKNFKIKKRNKFLKEDNSQMFLTFHNENNNEKIFNCISPIIKKEETKYEKNEFYRNSSLKLNRTFFKQNSISYPINYQLKINEKKKKLYNNFYNINDEIKIFENHLKEMRERSKETNSKVNILLIRRKKNRNLNQKCKDKNDNINHNKINDENYNILNNISKVNYNDKINNGYLNTHINSNNENNRKKNTHILF